MLINPYAEVEVMSASIPDFLTAVNNKGIRLSEIKYVNDLCVHVIVHASDYISLTRLSESRGEEVKLVKSIGICGSLLRVLKRPVLLFGVIIWLLLILFLPTKVLFIHVQGNQNIPSEHILEKAEKYGVIFGASRREIRSERVKNGILSDIPELQWVGVNTYGCVAVISVLERNQELNTGNNCSIANIVSAYDGVVCDLTVRKGTSLCKVGQAVSNGQILVSGYTDCGLYIKAEHADAEITAITLRKFCGISPITYKNRWKVLSVRHTYSIQFGKKLIKLYKDSGISHTTYAKMYTQIPVTLPGGFALPVKLVKETIIEYEFQSDMLNDTLDCTWMNDRAEAYIKEHMLSGQIMKCDIRSQVEADCYQFDGIYFCKEIISRIRYEELVNSNGQQNS